MELIGNIIGIFVGLWGIILPGIILYMLFVEIKTAIQKITKKKAESEKEQGST